MNEPLPEDRYREWDAAYVLGSLSPAERQEFEQHLPGCPECSAAVAELSGLPPILSELPPERAFALLEPEEQEPPNVLPLVARRAQRQRRMARLRAVALGVTAAAAAAVIALAVPWSTLGGAGRTAMTAAVPSPISAEARLVDGPWGTRIEGICRYAQRPGGGGKAWDYAMVVTDKQGRSTQVATWRAAPGSEVEFEAITRLPRDQIASYDIRRIGYPDADGKVLLTGRP